MRRSLRIRAVLDGQFGRIVVVLVVLALLGGWVTYTAYATPATTTVEREVSSWQYGGTFNHSATVTEPNALYPTGMTLTDRPIYFTRISPRLDGVYRLRYATSEESDLAATISIRAILRSVEDRRGEAVVVWERSRPLNETSRTDLAPGATVAVPFSVDMRETVNRSQLIEEQLGHPPGQPEFVVRATVSLTGTVDGRSVYHVETHDLHVPFTATSYRPRADDGLSEEVTTTETVTVPEPPSAVHGVGGPVLGAGAALAFVGLVAARMKGRLALSEREREVLQFTDDRREFDEWIARISLPPEVLERPRAHAASLGALVDFAIDTNSAVIEDPDTGRFHVPDNDLLYTYHPPTTVTGATERDAGWLPSPDSELDDQKDPAAVEATPRPRPELEEAK